MNNLARTLEYSDLIRIVKEAFPIVVYVTNSAMVGNRNILPEFLDALGPLATDWINDDGLYTTGVFHEDRRWDFLDGYRFRDERDAILFKMMTAEHDT